jgi:hypothetical protein
MVKNFGYSVAIFCMRCSSAIQSALAECPCKNVPTLEVSPAQRIYEEDTLHIN